MLVNGKQQFLCGQLPNIMFLLQYSGAALVRDADIEIAK